MVYWTSIHQQHKKDYGYGVEEYRVKHGFKEMHVHNAPPRKNKDFKPVLYGDFIGMLNFKLSEPWGLLRHLPDLMNEQHQKPIQWVKAFLRGAVIGTSTWMLVGTFSHFKD